MNRILGWGGFVFGLAGIILGLLGYMQAKETERTANIVQARQHIFAAWDLLGGTQGLVAIAMRDVSVDSSSLELARREIETALLLAPDLPLAHRIQSSYFGAMGMWKKSIQAAQRAVTLNGNDAESYNHLGVANLQLKKYRQAEENFKRALSIVPSERRYAQNLLLTRACQSDNPHTEGC